MLIAIVAAIVVVGFVVLVVAFAVLVGVLKSVVDVVVVAVAVGLLAVVVVVAVVVVAGVAGDGVAVEMLIGAVALDAAQLWQEVGIGSGVAVVVSDRSV